MEKKLNGLSQEEALERQKQGQRNTCKNKSSRTYKNIILSNLFSLLNLTIFLIALALVNLYFVFHEIKTVYDAITISTVAFLNSIVGIIQEIRAKRSLDKIKAMASTTATVIRNGNLEKVKQEDIVQDDVIKITRGEQVPVDGVVLDSKSFELDESLLTGESEYILKEENQKVLSGSFCVAGQGFIRAEKVGSQSYINQVTQEVKSYKSFTSPLEKKINFLVKIGVITAVIMFILILSDTFFDKYYWGYTPNWIAVTRKAASIVTAIIPIGLILLSSVTFALGVIRISKKGALIQKLNAIESFAHVTTICMDKTGTLTQNKLVFHKVHPLKENNLSETKKLLGTWAHLATDQNPTSIAIKKECGAYDGNIVDEIPFNSKNKYSAISVETGEKGRQNIFLGAFEKLSPFFKETEKAELKNLMQAQASYRNLVLASLPGSHDSLRSTLKSKPSLEAIGFVSLMDEIRPNIKEVLEHFHQKNIRLKIISGDAPETVKSVAKRAGWKEDVSSVITGSYLDTISRKELKRITKQQSLFARVSPQNKKDIIESLQEQKQYVSMVGDGVNDVLALKQAELGIAMFDGNSMSKDVSDIILIKNDFTVMPEVFKEGETILGNLSASAKLFLTKNIYAALLISLCAFLGLAFPLVPRHVTIMGFFTITIPALLITFTKRMSYKPSHFLKDILQFTFTTGIVIAGTGSFILYVSQNYLSATLDAARTVMLSQIIVLTLLNFILVLDAKKPFRSLKNTPALAFLVLSFLAIYFVGLHLVTHFDFLNGLKIFLELESLNKNLLILLGVSSFLSSCILVSLHKWRVSKASKET